MPDMFNAAPYLIGTDGKILVFDLETGTREATPEELVEFGL